jgi:hypothetical protein
LVSCPNNRSPGSLPICVCRRYVIGIKAYINRFIQSYSYIINNFLISSNSLRPTNSVSSQKEGVLVALAKGENGFARRGGLGCPYEYKARRLCATVWVSTFLALVFGQRLRGGVHVRLRLVRGDWKSN